MKKILLIIFILLSTSVFLGIAAMDKQYFICPIEYKGDIVIRSDNHGNGLFASSRSGRRFHKGIDLLAYIGTPVLTAKSGKVVCATENRGMGKYVIIRHRNNIITIYGHLSEIFVRKNDYLRQGQVVGSVGKTGNARYRDMLPHLHFEIRKNGVPQDPLEYI
ncbi:MAG: M23 family metallopeptidase [Candidatus Omnitrophota bacterium]